MATSTKFGSAGVTTREIDISGPVSVAPSGIPAGIIGTALKGPAFVPVTVGLLSDYYAKFGLTDGKKFGPLAVVEWLRNAQAVTYLRVLGCGDGTKRLTTGNNPGSVNNSGFVVGQQEPGPGGTLQANPYANLNGQPGQTFFLGCFMSESAGSTVFSAAGLQGTGSVEVTTITGSVPIVRGVLMSPSGVILTLSSSYAGTNSAPASTLAATSPAAANGAI